MEIDMGLPRLHRIASEYLNQKISMEFPTPEALKKYLHEHPGADKSLHKVVKTKKSPAPAPKKPLFSKEEMEMHPRVRQNTDDPDKLFKDAGEAHEQQLDWLNRGKGLDKVLGAKVVRGDKGEKSPDALDNPGVVIMIGPLKTRKRSEEKIKADKDMSWKDIGDLVRSSIAVDSADQIPHVMKKLRDSGLKLARRPKDRFEKPAPGNYRDILMNVTYPNGHVGELQLHLKPLLKAKNEEGHKIYDKIRPITEKAEREGTDTLTKEESRVIEEGMAEMRRIYDTAYEKALRPGKKAANMNSLKIPTKNVNFYEFDDSPVFWEKNKFPKKVTKSGDAVVIYGIYDFLHAATSISKSEFEALVKKRQ